MIDPFDYKEPSCALCGGEEFYYPDPEKPLGTIPVDRIMAKLDDYLDHNEPDFAQSHLEYWRNEAIALKDKRGELTILSEMMGLYRKRNNEEKGLEAVKTGVRYVEELKLSDTVSGATVFLNAATALKAFNRPKEALELYEKAEKIYEKELPVDDPNRAGLYNNRALTYVDLKQYDNAEKDYFRALDTLSRRPKNENEIAITYINIAHMYEHIPSKSVEEIASLLVKAYETLTSENIVKNGYHAFVLSKCAPSFGYFGFTEEEAYLSKLSKELYERN